MSPGQAALLAGVFGPPLLMLALGHAYRHRSPGVRGAFWGGVVGYSLGVVLTVAAMLLPAVAWAGGSAAREFAVHGSLLAAGTLGIAVGWVLGRRAAPRD